MTADSAQTASTTQLHPKQKSRTSSKSTQRLCLTCTSGNFVTTPMLQGECRRNPPKSYFSDGKPGRFFPPVRFDDWCSQFHQISPDVEVVQRLVNVAHFRSPEARRQLADQLFLEKDWLPASQLYETLYEHSSPDLEIAYRIGLALFRAGRKREDAELCCRSETWLREATGGGHAAAPMVLATLYKFGLGVGIDIGKANTMLQVSASRGYGPAQEWLDSGGIPNRQEVFE